MNISWQIKIVDITPINHSIIIAMYRALLCAGRFKMCGIIISPLIFHEKVIQP